MLEQESVHEKKYKRLNHIAEVMLDLKNHLQSEQVEYIELIQEKVVHLSKILDVFNMFYTNGAISTNMIGNIVRMKQNKENNVKNIILSNSNKSSNDFIKILSEKLKTFVLNLKNQVKNRIRINKRSIEHMNKSIEQLKSLTVNKISLKSEQINMSLNIFSIARSKMAFHPNKNINVRRLVIGIFEKDSNKNREKRATSLPFLDNPKIIANTINNVALENFLNGLFRNGKNTFINGML